jgi:hypothetical protein
MECNHFAAGALLSPNNLQILFTLKKFGSCWPFTLNEIPKESQLKDKTHSPNEMKPRTADEYNCDLFLYSSPTVAKLIGEFQGFTKS